MITFCGQLSYNGHRILVVMQGVWGLLAIGSMVISAHDYRGVLPLELMIIVTD